MNICEHGYGFLRKLKWLKAKADKHQNTVSQTSDAFESKSGGSTQYAAIGVSGKSVKTGTLI